MPGLTLLPARRPAPISASPPPVFTPFVNGRIIDKDNGYTTYQSQLVVTSAETTIALTASNDPLVYGQATTFTATLSANTSGAATPTGYVQFAIDGSNFGLPVPVVTSGGVNTATSASINTLSVGTHTVTATYLGDSNYLTSNSNSHRW